MEIASEARCNDEEVSDTMEKFTNILSVFDALFSLARTPSGLMNGDKVSATNKLKEYDQRLKIELSLKEKNVSAYESLTARNKLVESRFTTQMQLIDHKIKEVERIRLYLRVCEINSHGVDNADLDEFFSKKDCERKQQRWVIW